MRDLRYELEEMAPDVDVEGAWSKVAARIPQRRRSLALQRAGVALAAVAAVVALGWTILPAAEAPPVLETPVPPSVTTTAPGGEAPEAAPSQTAADAVRDRVVSELAQVPYGLRVEPLVSLDAPEGTWVLSELTDDLLDSETVEPGCRIGDPDGDPPPICAHEYGEILLVLDGAIARAFPAPGVPPSWLYLADEAVFAGRTGDGGLPHSTITRIDRSTLEAETIVFEHAEAGPFEYLLPGWRQATTPELDGYQDLVGFTSQGMEGVAVESLIGDIRVDLEGIHRLFDTADEVSTADLIRVDEVLRCGLQCFDVGYSVPASGVEAATVYPPDLEYGDRQTRRFDCSPNAGEIRVEPVADLDPSWGGDGSGCEAVLALGRWAAVSPYFDLDWIDGQPAVFRQIDGSWVAAGPENPACFGSPADPPACDLGHEAPDWFYMTIESVTYTGDTVAVDGTEWDISYVDATFEVGDPLGDVTIDVACSTGVEAPSERGAGWARILDACLLAELALAGEEFPGVYEVIVGPNEGIAGMVHRPEITLP